METAAGDYCSPRCQAVTYRYVPNFGCVRTHGSRHDTGRPKIPLESFSMDDSGEGATQPVRRSLDWAPPAVPNNGPGVLTVKALEAA